MITREILEEQIQELISYMKLKIKQRDWHGCADAANDIRELEAKKDLLNTLDDLDTGD